MNLNIILQISGNQHSYNYQLIYTYMTNSLTSRGMRRDNLKFGHKIRKANQKFL
jgi:hypothetical protein